MVDISLETATVIEVIIGTIVCGCIGYLYNCIQSLKNDDDKICEVLTDVVRKQDGMELTLRKNNIVSD